MNKAMASQDVLLSTALYVSYVFLKMYLNYGYIIFSFHMIVHYTALLKKGVSYVVCIDQSIHC